MGLFFDAGKYITRVESPRIDKSLTRKEQVLGYINKYFDSYNHDYLESVQKACNKYIDEMFEYQDGNTTSDISPEIQAITTIIKGLQGFLSGGELETLHYMRILAAKEAFTLHSAMISKSIDLGLIDIKHAKRRIAKFYKDCKIDW